MTPPIPDGICLFIGPGPFKRFSVTIYENGRRASSFSTTLPSSLRQLSKKMTSYEFNEIDFIDYLHNDSPELPILIKQGSQYLNLYWDPKIQLKRDLFFHLDQDEIRVHRGNRPMIQLGESLVALPDEKKLVCFEEDTNWSLWEDLWQVQQDIMDEGSKKKPSRLVKYSFASLTDTLLMDRAIFNQSPAHPNLSQVNCYIGNEKASVKLKKVSYILGIHPSQKPDFRVIKPQLLIGENKVNLDPMIPKRLCGLQDEIECINTQSDLRLFLGIMGDFIQKGPFSAMRELLQAPFISTKSDIKQIKSLIRESAAALTQPVHRLLALEEEWCFNHIDLGKELKIWLYLYHRMGVSSVKRALQVEVENRNLFEIIETLTQFCKEEDIEIIYESDPIEVVDWEIEIDGHKEGLDEDVLPVVTQGETSISSDKWQGVLETDWLLDEDGKVSVLSKATREKIKLLLTIMGGQDHERQKKKETSLKKFHMLDWLLVDPQGIKLTMNASDQAMMAALTAKEIEDKWPLPDKVKIKPRAYQREGYEWLCMRYQYRLGGILADDMGLGKTLQSIMLLGAIKEGKIKSHHPKSNGCHLIVLPPSLIFNWQCEFEKCYPDFKIREYSKEVRKSGLKDCEILLITYELVRREIDFLMEIEFDVIIFDEAQLIKNITAARTQAAKELRANFKVCLTGTPLENHLGEYYSIVDLVLPGLLGKYTHFHKVINTSAIEFLVKRTTPFLLRRIKEQIHIQLPPKTIQDIRLTLSDDQRAYYHMVVKQVKTEINEAFDQYTSSKARILALTALLRLRQICISPALIDSDYHHTSPKLLYLIDHLKELKEEGHSALVFSQFTKTLDLIEPMLQHNNIDYQRLDGQTTVQSRRKVIDSFQNASQPKVLIMSLRVGGVGLNLTKASYVFHLDPWWNPAVENQATDRAHRIGQTKPVNVMRLVMHNTIEEKLLELQKQKSHLFQLVVDGITENMKPHLLTKKDFDYLLID